MTLVQATPLHQGMKPWKLRIDWLLSKHYGEPVVVELHIMDEVPKTLQRFPGPRTDMGERSNPALTRAIDYAMRYITSRGFDFWCNVDWHQRNDHTHITLHAVPKLDEAVESGSDGERPC